MLYKENRPQWIRDDLSTHNELECSMEYGNPSGHSMIAATFAFALVFDHMEINKNRTRNVRIAYAIAHTCAAVLYAFIMGISRVIVAHLLCKQSQLRVELGLIHRFIEPF